MYDARRISHCLGTELITNPLKDELWSAKTGLELDAHNPTQ